MAGPVAITCDHVYGSHILGGHPISVRLCTLCHTPDWNDLYDQAVVLYQWGRDEALAGKPTREKLSAYDMPRESSPSTAATVSTLAEDCCGAEPPSGWQGDCWCTLPPAHTGEHRCQPCTDRHGAPGWNEA